MADANITMSLTITQQIRLNCVQMAYRHDRPSDDILKRAEELARFVEGQQAADEPAAPVKAGKRVRPANVEQVGPETDLI